MTEEEHKFFSNYKKLPEPIKQSVNDIVNTIADTYKN